MTPDKNPELYHSAEIRWFIPGQEHVGELLSWFRLHDQIELIVEGPDYVKKPEAGPFVKFERTRWDKYLLLSVSDSASIKQRQGKLEVKVLVAGPRPFSSGEVFGRIDQWVKWSFEPSDQGL